MTTSIVIPAYNEEKNIKKTVMGLFNEIKKLEIIIVSDGSTDATNSVVKNLQKKYSTLKLIKLSKRSGKGIAIIKGFEITRGNIIGFLDADNPFLINKIKQMIDSLNGRKVDCVIGSKWKNVNFKDVKEPNLRKIFARIWNLLIRLLFNLRFYDTQCGAKFIKRNVLKDIGLNFICRGYEMDVELLWKISKRGYSIKECFLSSSSRVDSKFRMKNCVEMLINILKLRFSTNLWKNNSFGTKRGEYDI